MHGRNELAVFFAVVGLLAPRLGAAQSEPEDDAFERARAFKQEGFAAVKRGDYGAAIEALEKAYEVVPKPGLLFNIAVVYDQWGGHCKQSLSAFDRFFEACPQCNLRPIAEARVEKVRERCEIPLIIRTDPTGAEVSIDGSSAGPSPVATKVGPGLHEIEARFEGYAPTLAQVFAEPGQTYMETIVLTPATDGRLVIKGAGRTRSLFIDGKRQDADEDDLELELSAGTHYVMVFGQDGKQYAYEPEVEPGKTTILETPVTALVAESVPGTPPPIAAASPLAFRAPRPEPESSTTALEVTGWITFSLGLAAAGAGGFFTWQALGTLDDEDEARLAPNPSRDEILDLQDQANQEVLFAHLGYGVGAGLIVAGLVMALVDTGDDDEDGPPDVLEVEASPTGLHVRF